MPTQEWKTSDCLLRSPGFHKHFQSKSSTSIVARNSPQQKGAVSVGDLPELRVVPLARVRRPTAHEHRRLEKSRQTGQVLVVDDPSLGVDPLKKGQGKNSRSTTVAFNEWQTFHVISYEFADYL